MTAEIKKQAETKMDKAIQVLKKDLATIRAGRANPALLDKIVVEYYGADTPLNQVANISTPDPRSLIVQPWDPSILADVERAIINSDLGLTPNNDGKVIRITIPMLTEERRNELIKVVKKTGEESKVAIRNIRREANDELKKRNKEGEITEDETRRGQDEIQKMTDRFVKQVDQVISQKEKEMLEI
jgi:ribosome recycling factor